MATKRRSGEAQAAQHRKAGPMSHRLKPRGGAKNDQPELLDDIDDEDGIMVTKTFRLNEKHPLHAKLQKLWDVFDKEGVKLDILRDGTFVVMDTKTNESFEMKDADNGGTVGHLPPVFEYKLTFEKQVKE